MFLRWPLYLIENKISWKVVSFDNFSIKKQFYPIQTWKKPHKMFCQVVCWKIDSPLLGARLSKLTSGSKICLNHLRICIYLNSLITCAYSLATLFHCNQNPITLSAWKCLKLFTFEFLTHFFVNATDFYGRNLKSKSNVFTSFKSWVWVLWLGVWR